jgi:hypothetical protein
MSRPIRKSPIGERTVLHEDSRAAIAEYIRTRGVTRCPTACLVPTQGFVDAADRAALQVYADARERLRQAQAAAEDAASFELLLQQVGGSAETGGSPRSRKTILPSTDTRGWAHL